MENKNICHVCCGTGYIKTTSDDEQAVYVNDRYYKICPKCLGKGKILKKKINLLEVIKNAS